MKMNTLAKNALAAAAGLLGAMAVLAAARDTDAAKWLRRAFD